MRQPVEDKRLKDYLLGNLPESEEVRLEEEYLASSDAQDRLAAVEDDLVDAFLQGQLSARQRQQLEVRFLASPRGRRKLELARSLMALAAGQKLALAPKSFPLYRLRWAFTAAALLLICALGWWISVKVRQTSTPEHAGVQPTNPNPWTAVQPTQTPAPTASPENTRPAMLASIMLRPVGRSTEQSARLRIPRGTRTVQIQLDLEADQHKNYKVTLLGAGDEPKWSGRHLKAEAIASGKAIVLSLPATLFEKGEYTVLLAPDENGSTPIAEYAFVVQRK